ncbi:MAG: hypothetical protein ACKVQR_15010 [Aquabacterium sp.]
MALDLTFKPFSGVGVVTLYPIVSGAANAGYDLGEAPVFKLSTESPVAEMKTSRDSARGTAYRMAQSKAANLEIQLRTLNDYNLSLITGGVWTDVAGGSQVVDWVAPTGLVLNQVIRLPARNVSTVSVKDSSGTPKTLPSGQYELDALGGTLKLLDITTGGAYVQPFKVTYTPGAVAVLGGLKAPDADFLVQLNGTNAYNGERGIFEGFKFRFAQEGEADWISEEFGTWTLRGSLLLDTARLSNSAGGQYYSWTRAGA